MKPEQLARLSQKEKLELLDAIEERRRRARLRPGSFKPHREQLEVLQDDSEERFVFCGNGWGKTAMLGNQALAWADGRDPWKDSFTSVPCTIIVVLDLPDKVEKVWLKELRKWAIIPEESLKKHGRPYVTEITRPNGSSIQFMFHEQGELAFESIEPDFVIFDEPPPRHIYVGLIRGQREKDKVPKLLLGGTPLAAPWLRTEVYEPWIKGARAGTKCFRGRTEANEANLREGYIAGFSSKLSAKERKIRLEGEFFDLDGLALAHLFDRKLHIRPEAPDVVREKAKRERWPCVVAIDPHPSKPVHAVLVALGPLNQIYVLREWREKLTARQWAGEYFDWADGYHVNDIVCDSLGSAETTGGEGFKSFLQVLGECGVRARATTYSEKQDEAWLDRITEALQGEPPKLQLLSDCRGLQMDIEQVQWVKYRNVDVYKPKLDISNKDFLSALKYALATNIGAGNRRSRVIGTTNPVGWRSR